MSDLDPDPPEVACPAVGSPGAVPPPAREVLDGVPVALGGPRGLPVTRALPHRKRRMVGPWCFLDAFGPVALGPAPEGAPGPGMQVAPHPHTGLQTVSWLVEGEIWHLDSLGSRQLVRPGQLNLMTAGRGISHSEQTPAEHSGRLHGVQLWVALPDSDRFVEPRFEHLDDLPRVALPHRSLAVPAAGIGPGAAGIGQGAAGIGQGAAGVGPAGSGAEAPAQAVVLVGDLAGARSRARLHSPAVAAEVRLAAGEATVPLIPEFEHALLVLTGSVAVPGHEGALEPGPLLYLGGGAAELRLSTAEGATVLLIGGVPLGEDLVMWWNFVGRSHEEIAGFREDWAAGRRFGTVEGYPGEPLPAPALPNVRLRSRPAVPRTESR